MPRACFFSFHYRPDSVRAARVRNIGAIEGNSPASDNDWEAIKGGGDDAIKRWINGQMDRRTCAIVLVGMETANRKWINYEIVKAWKDGLGIVGIRIHGLVDFNGQVATRGLNPFDYIGFGTTGAKLSSTVKCYDPQGSTSTDRYNWIRTHLANAVEEAIKIRKDAG